MPDLVPWSLLLVGTDTEAFGEITYEGDSVTWPLAAMQSRAGSSFQGLVPDPTGDYFMQAPVTLWQPSGTAAWTTSGGTFAQGLDTSVQTQAGASPATLYQSNPAGQASAIFTAAFDDDEGMVLRLWAGAPPAGSTPNLYAYFNEGAGAATLRLAVEPGLPVRLQTPAAASPTGWADLAAASDPDAESYLQRWGGRLDVDVLSECDPDWDPSQAQYSDAPPSRLVVMLNGGDEVLALPALTLPGGSVQVSATDRQWGALVGRKRFGTAGTVLLPAVTHPVAYEGYPYTDFVGYVPPCFDEGGISIGVAPGGSQYQAVAQLTLAVPSSGIDATGYATASVFLTALTADFPAQQTAPLDAPDWAQYLPVYGDVTLTYDSGRSLKRASGQVSFIDTQGLLAPVTTGDGAGIEIAVRAFQLYLGMLPPGVAPTPGGLTLVMSGYTGMRAGKGFGWRRQGGQTVVTVSLDDPLIMAQKATLYMPAADGTCHYWGQRQAAYRCGFTDERLNFPYCAKYDPGEYQLSYGTALNPKFAPRPEDQLLDFMLQIRADSGDVDPDSGQIQPMVLGCDAAGALDYFPLPVGVVQTFQNPGQDPAAYGLTPIQAFSAAPLLNEDGSPQLNELLQFLETVASLDQIRSEAVFEGRDVATGDAVVASALNPQLTTDPDQAGYIGAVRRAYVQISRRVSSLPVAQRQAALAQALLAFPAIRAAPVGHLQPDILILAVISVTDYATQGTDAPVGYYTTSVRHWFGARNDCRRFGLTFLGGPLLGQTG